MQELQQWIELNLLKLVDTKQQHVLNGPALHGVHIFIVVSNYQGSLETMASSQSLYLRGASSWLVDHLAVPDSRNRHLVAPGSRVVPGLSTLHGVSLVGGCWLLIFFRIESTNPRSLKLSHIIHVWYIHLHLLDSYGTFIGKYTSPMDPMGITDVINSSLIRPASWVIPSLVDHHCFKLWTWKAIQRRKTTIMG